MRSGGREEGGEGRVREGGREGEGEGGSERELVTIGRYAAIVK